MSRGLGLDLAAATVPDVQVTRESCRTTRWRSLARRRLARGEAEYEYEQSKRRRSQLLALPSPQAQWACVESGVSRRPTLAAVTVVQDYVRVAREARRATRRSAPACRRLARGGAAVLVVQVGRESRRTTRWLGLA